MEEQGGIIIESTLFFRGDPLPGKGEADPEVSSDEGCILHALQGAFGWSLCETRCCNTDNDDTDRSITGRCSAWGQVAHSSVNLACQKIPNISNSKGLKRSTKLKMRSWTDTASLSDNIDPDGPMGLIHVRQFQRSYWGGGENSSMCLALRRRSQVQSPPKRSWVKGDANGLSAISECY